MKLKTVALAGLAAAAVALPVTLTLSAQAEDTGDPGTKAGEFYVDPDNNAATWVKENGDNPNAEKIKTSIADNVVAKWFGDWENIPVSEYVANAAEAGGAPVLVAYNMYQRDCGGQSGGGADSVEEYKTWIADFAKGVGDSDAYVILEPDALSQMVAGNCDMDVAARKELLAYGVDQFATNAPNAKVYLDAGNYSWPGDAGAIADALKDAGVEKIRGFAVNVSNHYKTDQSDEKAKQILDALGTESHYVVDTSRNGSGKTQDGEDSWCNPKGATLGETSTVGEGAQDARIWIKVPGDSDGDCGYGQGVPAGQFSEKLAMGLITGEYP
ncbi:glycoside hydrolase family 6 protein [Stackebrandtia nassauensis]|uniref:Glucanase n=1 Tax=Stackebrandtia nassauensis (strain DSM 44728 / CIP 108903 / NRRL B-16338 / NBRC 102104 / LLR-40K-21) TaxID=446470 RepID=D3Q463_STANL|nr:glycoside hydrolase family 6 protein [Stackebrandtia nassauensis]ADD45948.1 Cellulase [Stackebrandtia nassauensis DSM 44728]